MSFFTLTLFWLIFGIFRRNFGIFDSLLFGRALLFTMSLWGSRWQNWQSSSFQLFFPGWHISVYNETYILNIQSCQYLEMSYDFFFFHCLQFNDSNEEDRKELEGFALKMISRAKVSIIDNKTLGWNTKRVCNYVTNQYNIQQARGIKEYGNYFNISGS